MTRAALIKLKVTTRSAAQTKRLGAKLAPLLDVGDALLFQAQLGAGKTTFVQGLAAAMGARGAALSPTFIVAETIEARVPIHHLDFYRLTLKEILGLGVEDYLNGAGAVGPGVLLIEWAERFRPLWPKERIDVKIRVGRKKDERTFELTARGERPSALLTDLAKKIR